jgi:hypothetical protein
VLSRRKPEPKDALALHAGYYKNSQRPSFDPWSDRNLHHHLRHKGCKNVARRDIMWRNASSYQTIAVSIRTSCPVARGENGMYNTYKNVPKNAQKSNTSIIHYTSKYTVPEVSVLKI